MFDLEDFEMYQLSVMKKIRSMVDTFSPEQKIIVIGFCEKLLIESYEKNQQNSTK